jgi:pimeloyl-ACP methyl ester carboxylesterase
VLAGFYRFRLAEVTLPLDRRAAFCCSVSIAVTIRAKVPVRGAVSLISMPESNNAVSELSDKLAGTIEISSRISTILQKRLASAREHFDERVKKILAERGATQAAMQASSWDYWCRYAIDTVQRGILFWDVLRQRGNNFIEHERAGLPPVLHFDSETVMDGRSFERPVNYALLRILPPAGVEIDSTRRPFVIIDPRAGHGPGIGGFKDDSQVGVALRGGHPVYFVIFFPEPEPGQTLLDVCDAEAQFVRRVRELHPQSPKPVVVGNCQGGWAAMMLAASDPENTGPIVINGAPMSYWGGAWREGDEGDNPMRYAGGLLGGSWLSSFVADLGNGRFDGAHLVQNFENLDPAHSLWEKYYNLFANADTEAERFLDFERWWGGFYLLNRDEIEWITQNLFVGNRLVSGDLRGKGGDFFDLRNIRSPLIVFASLGDNITPPQQAFNWVADVYGSTEEIKARGQIIVGLLHREVGHLGIFVAGHVVRKEHTQIVSVLESIAALPPGIYGMEILDQPEVDGQVTYDVQFVEYRLEDVVQQLNRYQRRDERPFEAVHAISEFNQRAYEMFAQPFVRAWSNDFTARLRRDFHPLRFSRWGISDRNPWLWWLGGAAKWVRAQRATCVGAVVSRAGEALGAELISASLDHYRECRDAIGAAAFFRVYGTPHAADLTERARSRSGRRWRDEGMREVPVVKKILEAIADGGYPEAVGRLAALMSTTGVPLPLAGVAARHDFAVQNRDLMPGMDLADLRRIEGRQEIIVRNAFQRALDLLPALVPQPADRDRLIKLIDRACKHRGESELWLNDEQRALLERVRLTLLHAHPRPRAAHAAVT